MPVLAAEVKRGEPAAVLYVEVCFRLAQGRHRLAEPLPGGLVQRRVPVLKLWTQFDNSKKMKMMTEKREVKICLKTVEMSASGILIIICIVLERWQEVNK